MTDGLLELLQGSHWGRSQLRATDELANAGWAQGLTANRRSGARSRQEREALEHRGPARLLASAPPPRRVPALPVSGKVAELALAARPVRRSGPSLRFGGYREGGPRAWGFPPPFPGLLPIATTPSLSS